MHNYLFSYRRSIMLIITIAVSLISLSLPLSFNTVCAHNGVLLRPEIASVILGPTTVNFMQQASAGRVKFSSSVYSAREDETMAMITVIRTDGSNGTISVPYVTEDGTARAGSDYLFTNGVLVFADGEVSQSFVVRVQNDTEDEGLETVTVRIMNPGNGAILDEPSTATLTIVDNDGAPTMSINDIMVSEGDTGTRNVSFTVTLSAAANAPVTAQFATSNGTATAGVDYTSASGRVNFDTGVIMQTIIVEIIGDTIAEPTENFTVTLSNASNVGIDKAQGTCSIIDNDVTNGTIQFSQPAFTVNEGDGRVNIIVTRTGGSSGTISVNYTVMSGTAVALTDFRAPDGMVIFASGDTAPKTISVEIIEDTQTEGDETFTLALSNPFGGAIIGLANTVVTIRDNDFGTAAEINFITPEFFAVESDGMVTVTVTRTGGSNSTSTVFFNTDDGTALNGSDYVLQSGTLTFNPGSTSQTVTIRILDDNLTEGNERINLLLSAPTGGATLGRVAQAVITIVDNEGGPVLTAERTLDFGTVALGQSATRTITLRNAGTAQLNLALPVINSGTDVGFAIASAPSTLSLGPNETVGFGVSFTPRSNSPVTGSVIITSNGGSVTVMLLGQTQNSSGDFTLIVDPATQTIGQGGMAQFRINAQASGGFNQQIALAANVMPVDVGISTNFTSTTINAMSGSVLTVSARADATPRTYAVTIVGMAGATVRSQTVIVNVTGGPDFSLSFAQPTLTLSRGQRGTINVNINRSGGFTGNVTVTAPDTKPIKVKLTPPSAASTGASVSFTIKAKAKAVLGSQQLTFMGRDDQGRVRTANLTLTIQ